MSGHSKWATTKRKKARIDSARAKAFNRVLREITVAAKLGGGDQEANARLRAAVLKAKSVNMPNKNIETAISKATNELKDVQYFEPTYEGYGPGGISILVECQTENKVRTVANIRHLFSRFGGNLGEAGSVAWMFQSKGFFALAKETVLEESLMEFVLEAGADDMETDESEYRLYCKLENFHALAEALSTKNWETTSSELVKLPDTTLKISGEIAEKAAKLLEALEEDDDVQNVYTNAELELAD